MKCAMFSFNLCPFVSVVVSVALLSTTVAAYGNECYSNSDCDYGYSCCTGPYPHVCSFSCVGISCESSSECGGPNECCGSSQQCTRDCSCDSESDCVNGEKCCKESTDFLNTRSFCNSSCLGISCSSNSDCSYTGVTKCCGSSRKCTDSCLGISCSSDSDCGDIGVTKCCGSSRKCTDSCLGLSCSSDSDCGDTGVTKCCGSSGKCTDCPDLCSSNSDCSYGKYCCGALSDYDGSCYSDCVGKFCSKNSECGGPDECCDLHRRSCTSNCPLPSWAIGLIIAGFFLILLIPFAIYRCVVVWKSSSRDQLTEDNVLLIQDDSRVVSLQNSQDQSGPSFLPSRPPPYSFDISEPEAVSL